MLWGLPCFAKRETPSAGEEHCFPEYQAGQGRAPEPLPAAEEAADQTDAGKRGPLLSSGSY